MKTERTVQYKLWEEAQRVVNVASVPQRSPFRYPGGKTWLIPRIRQWLSSYSKKPKLLVEPFAGGAIVGLTVAFENLADQVVLIELDEQVAAVWETIINIKGGARWLASRIINIDLTAESASSILQSKPKSKKELAFKTIIQNRVSHGGILAQGAGLLKSGENGKGILSRWYPETLKKRILDIEQVKHRIEFVSGNAFDVINEYLNDAETIFFVDPPYTASKKQAGRRLYKYHELNHQTLFQIMGQVAGDFLMTYDDSEEVRSLAVENGFEVKPVDMTGTHNARRTELLVGRNLSWLREY
ncbi:MAG: DNA adenine methylase [Anaerolineales bacterium]|nr:DNA adenine methylase [Anaerolineales bacterium]